MCYYSTCRNFFSHFHDVTLFEKKFKFVQCILSFSSHFQFPSLCPSSHHGPHPFSSEKTAGYKWRCRYLTFKNESAASHLPLPFLKMSSVHMFNATSTYILLYDYSFVSLSRAPCSTVTGLHSSAWAGIQMSFFKYWTGVTNQSFSLCPHNCVSHRVLNDL